MGIRETRQTQMNSDFALEQNLDFITKGLSAKASLSYDNNIISERGLYDNNALSATGNLPLTYINWKLYTGPTQDPSVYTTKFPVTGKEQFDWAWQPPSQVRSETIGTGNFSTTIPVERRMDYQFQTNYNRKFGLHNIGALALVKREEYANGSMFKNYREDWVFRTTYDYATRYLFEMNGAYNGSEQFGPGYRFAFFPSVALGWVVSNEKFFHLDWMNKLKFRYSNGLVGNDNVSNGARWLYSSQYSYGGYAPLNQNPTGTSPYTWYKEALLGNPDIHWEKSHKTDFGLEMGLFKNLISLTYDYFTEDRTDILLAGSSRSIPPFFGIAPPSANLGRVKSNGHEIELKIDKRMTNGLHLWATIDLAHTMNKVLFKDDPLLLAAYQKAAGFPVGQYRSQIRAGFMNNWDQIYASVPYATNDLGKLPGGYNILDFNGDGSITADDSEPIGYTSIPQNTYNTSLGADYKGFSIMVQFYGVNNVSRSVPYNVFQLQTDIAFNKMADYWSKDNENAPAYLPRWKATGGLNIGDYFLYDASYLRLKTAEIAYTFQEKWVKKIGLSALKLYLNGENLFFWSKLPDDREASFSGGADYQGTYPTVKRINLGIDVTF
jgi:TonB-linked SusC/RagA family outer membrane protein